MKFHEEKEFFLAPYLADNHWSLFITAPKIGYAYILDSLLIREENDPSCCLLTNLIREALPIDDFTFSMVQCKQQASCWECGYMVIQYIFVDVYHRKFPKKDSIDLLQGHYVVSVSRDMAPTAPKGRIEAIASLPITMGFLFTMLSLM